MSEHNCSNCDAFLANADLKVKAGLPQLGWCRAKPPIPAQAMVRVASPLDPRGGQQAVPGWQGVFPPTSSDWWCREWKPVWARNARVIEHDGNLERPAAHVESEAGHAAAATEAH